MSKLTIALALLAAVALVAFGVVAAAARPRVEPPHRTSMADSAAAMLRDAGLRAGDAGGGPAHGRPGPAR